jgi:hypothetical protein
VEVQKRDRERIEGYRKPAVLLCYSGGMATQVCAAERRVSLGFGEGERAWTEGIK